MTSWLGQYCVNVSNLEASIAFYTALGLACTSCTEIPQAHEAIVEQPAKGSKLQLAQQLERSGPLDMGTMWKLYVHTDDVVALHGGAIEAGHTSIMEPTRLGRWPATVSFL